MSDDVTQTLDRLGHEADRHILIETALMLAERTSGASIAMTGVDAPRPKRTEIAARVDEGIADRRAIVAPLVEALQVDGLSARPVNRDGSREAALELLMALRREVHSSNIVASVGHWDEATQRVLEVAAVQTPHCLIAFTKGDGTIVGSFGFSLHLGRQPRGPKMYLSAGWLAADWQRQGVMSRLLASWLAALDRTMPNTVVEAEVLKVSAGRAFVMRHGFVEVGVATGDPYCVLYQRHAAVAMSA